MIMYRDATPADAAALATLGADTFTQTFGHLYTPADLALFLENHAVDRWADDVDDPAIAIRLAEEDKTLIGYAKLGPPHLPFTPAQGAAELRALYVLRPWHGTGVAATLIEWAIATARGTGVSELFLSVFIDNPRARRFYERYGFESVGTYAFMVGTHADEDIVMRLAL